jgi:predicted ATP-dependent endonuclease of OLD family
LHPHATKLLDNILGEISKLQNTQIFYSTHSPDLVSNFKKDIYEISDIVFVKKENNITESKKIINK